MSTYVVEIIACILIMIIFYIITSFICFTCLLYTSECQNAINFMLKRANDFGLTGEQVPTKVCTFSLAARVNFAVF